MHIQSNIPEIPGHRNDRPPMVLVPDHQSETKESEKDDSHIPRLKGERNRILNHVVRYIRDLNTVPPLSLKELDFHAWNIIQKAGLNPEIRDYIMVLINNALWEETVASVPYVRRILLLPQCLRNQENCPAEMDEFGLLCQECGGCSIGSLQAEAEGLGYVVLIAEGTTVVTKLLETGQVDTVIGVSCLSAMEKSFPHMASSAIPGIAIPLYKNGCVNTKVDIDWIRNAVRLYTEETRLTRINLDHLKSNIKSWFDTENLTKYLLTNNTKTEELAVQWMSVGGKRWRPFLAACVYQALQGNRNDFPDSVKKTAIAIECFHKASLAHDDIEDNDELRYNQPTLYKKVGTPVALNIGDLLVGEGYCLISESGLSENLKNRMLSVASLGHRSLCLGQGEELNWMQNPTPLSIPEILKIFKGKTAPAFEVALSLGAICAGANGELCEILKSFSEALGIAYQIRDDIEDFQDQKNGCDILALRPSLMFALAGEEIGKPDFSSTKEIQRFTEKCKDPDLKQHLGKKAWQMFEDYKTEALMSLEPLHHIPLKSLLFRIVYKILDKEQLKPE